MPPDIEAVAEQVFAALADPTRRAILAALASGGPATATDLAGAAADHPAGDRQAPGPAGRGRTGHGRTGGAAPGPVPAAFRADAGGPAVPGRAGPRLGRRARRAEGPPRPRRRSRSPSKHEAETKGGHRNADPSRSSPPTGVGGSAPAAAGEGEGADPRPRRDGRASGGGCRGWRWRRPTRSRVRAGRRPGRSLRGPPAADHLPRVLRARRGRLARPCLLRLLA